MILGLLEGIPTMLKGEVAMVFPSEFHQLLLRLFCAPLFFVYANSMSNKIIEKLWIDDGVQTQAYILISPINVLLLLTVKTNSTHCCTLITFGCIMSICETNKKVKIMVAVANN